MPPQTVAGAGRTLRISAGVVIAAAFLFLVAWLVVPLIQSARAGSMLEDANRHIESANGSLAGLRVDLLNIDGFTSMDAIAAAAESLPAADTLIESSSADLQLATEKVTSASGLHLLPSWYGEYLARKREVAELRDRQLQILAEASSRLSQLYTAAPLIFQSMQEMDRLLGQLQDAIAQTQDSPEVASAQLAQIASSMRDIQQQLDTLNQETGFELLRQMAQNVADNAALAEAAGLLADAVASGNQDMVQQAASTLEQRLLDTTVGVDYLDLWFSGQLSTLKGEYDELQGRQEKLDVEASGLYEANSGN